MTELKLQKLKYLKASSPIYAILKSFVKLSFKKQIWRTERIIHGLLVNKP